MIRDQHLTHHIRFLHAAVLIIALLALAACGDQAALTAGPIDTGAQAEGPADQPAEAGGEPTVGPPAVDATQAVTPLPEVEGYWIAPGTPQSLVDALAPAMQSAGLAEASSAEAAILTVEANPPADALLSARWVYAVAAPFPTVPDDVSWSALAQYWQSGIFDGLVGFDAPPQLVLTQDIVDWLTAELGAPAGGLPLLTVEPAALEEAAWNNRPSLSILPFDALTPRWKVLRLDGQDVFDKSLNMDTYPLVRTLGVRAVGDRGQQVAEGLAANGLWPDTNRDAGRITIVTLTGVTALVRATAMMMESQGIDYPAQGIMPFLQDADILHTSNEVSFSPNCPPPDWVGPPADFCSDPRYFDLLKTIGLDVVESTGNHINDIGTDAFVYTLAAYDNNNIVYFGGGLDIDDARQPRIVNAPDGTRVAFVGCNDPGPWTAFATAESAGAASCDDWTWMTDTIAALKANDQADVVIATVQYWELESYSPSAEQVADFDLLAQAGADVVLGSQAHQPQGFGFTNGAFIHYGIGNLFFDQMDYIENRQMFADKLILYEGRHISTVLFTGLLEDWSQPNPMTPEDRAAFLDMMFTESGW